MRDYAERKAARIERLRARAAGKSSEAGALESRASQMASAIPFGQPILVGHHSEGRDRRYREHIRGTFDQACAAGKEARSLEARADAAENNHAISSDDPEAPDKLREKIAALETEQANDKAINRAVRSKNPQAALAALGVCELAAIQLLTPDYCGRIGIADYVGKNRGANIRRLKQRLTALESKAAAPVPEPETHGDIRIEETENRVRIFFPGKPSEEMRDALKARGFRWSPSEGAWQRFASEWAWHCAREVARIETP